MKSKQAKLYIPIFKQVDKEGKQDSQEIKVTLLNAANIPHLKDILPDEETLITHMQIQRVKVEMDENYTPIPFEICIESSIFSEIIKVIQREDRLTNRNQIALFTSYLGIPITVISIRKS